MFFSKSFGYAVRGVLYIAMMQDVKHFVQVEEIARKLNAPKHFMGKILKRLVKEKVLRSVKGPSGGFTLYANALDLPLRSIVNITDGSDTFEKCVLSVKECNASNPCPMHDYIVAVKTELQATLSDTRIGDLLKSDKDGFLKSLSATNELSIIIKDNKEKIY